MGMIEMNKFDQALIALKIQQCQTKPCILCGKQSDGAGVFVPDDEFAAKVGKPKNKLRLYVYALCSRCKKKKKWMEMVEDSLLVDTMALRKNVQN